MLHAYRNSTLFLTLLLTLLCTCVRAQTTQLLQDFEGLASDNLPYSSNMPFAGTGASPTWNVVSSMQDVPGPSSGASFFGARNTGGNPFTLTFDAGTVCNLTSAKFVLDYFAFELDGADDIYYELVVDGLGQGQGSIIEGENSPTGPISSGGWQTFTVSIPGTAQTAQLIITVDQNGAADKIGIDNVRVTATGTGGSCNPVCGVSVNPTNIFFNCATLTAGADMVTAVIPYSGAEVGATVSASAGTVGGDDPATVQDGEITVSGLTEGMSYTLTISGGDCSLFIPLEPMVDQCAEGLVLINEFQASPSASEFVEVVSIATEPLDVTGYTFEDRTGNAMDFPAVTLQPGEGIVLFLGSVSPPSSGCIVELISGVALNDDGDDIIIRNAAGQVVAQYTYTGSQVVSGQSLARTPDRDPAGIFALHSTVADDGSMSSPCFENQMPGIALPLELLSFTAYAAGKNVSLSWSTTNEIDNDHFVVERRMSNEEWEAIGRVAAGSAAANTYDFTDENPVNGDNYYRLRQLDVDGSAALYGPVMAAFRTTEFRVYPNPATNEIRFGGAWEATDRISLISASGGVLRVLTPGVDRAGVEDLPRGIYLLRIERSAGTEVVRFVKQ